MRSPAFARFTLIVFVTLTLLTGCIPPGAGGIVVQDPYARPAPNMGGSGGAFMVIANNSGQADRLLSATSPIAKMVELHETIMEGEVMKMVHQPQGFELPAGSKVELKPGGKHIMLMNLVAPLEAGQTIQITLKFEKAGEQTISVPVREMK